MTAHFSRPPILERIPRGHHVVIEASAGTGKTFTIENMIVDLILRERVSLTEILVLTFTERAAAELRERIRTKIESILRVAEDSGGPVGGVPEPGWLIDSAGRQNLSRALFSFDGASIGTIHGFFGRVLTEHAFANGRLFDGTLADGRELFDHAFKTALRRSLARRPSDAADLLALWLQRGHGGVDRLEGLLWACHASRRRILPPFSMEEMRREIAGNPLFDIDLETEALPFKAALKGAKIHASTVKAMMDRMSTVAEQVRASGRSWEMALDTRFQEAVAKIAKEVANRDLAGVRAQDIADAFVRLDRVLVPLEAAIVQTSLPIVQELLEKHKATTGDFDHDDQITGVTRALDGRYGDELVHAMRSRYRFALIDEFQDTDELQWAFFERVFVGSKSRNLIYLIGDPKQAIYGFRGADVYTYLQARRRVEQAGKPLVPLEENFRSTPDLIAAYNHILDSAAQPPFFDGEIRYDRPVTAGREFIAEQAGGKPGPPIHLLKIETADGDALTTGQYRRDLARQIAREARDLLSDEKGLWFGPRDETRPIQPGDIYVLTATNNEAVQVSEALREAEVPFAFYKQEGLFQTAEARSIHNLLAAIADPADADKRGRAWITPFFAVPIAALPDLEKLPDSGPLFKRLQDWKRLAESRQFEAMFARILDESGIIRRERFQSEDERALTNYLHIFEILLEEARTVGRDLTDLIATLTAYIQQTRRPSGEDGNIQRLESDRAAVQIMTIHKSKGLEAAVVFLYGGFGRFRGSGTYEYHDDGQRVIYIGDDDEAKEKATADRNWEEQRLYYVALTRAKARLYLPLVPAKLGGRKWDGSYSRLNDRLTAIASQGEESPRRGLFRIVPFQVRPLESRRDGPGHAGGDPSTWQPDPKLLQKRDRSRAFARYRRTHAGYIVSSYSKMKRAWSGELDPLQRDEFHREPGAKTVAPMLDDGDLPGGTATGTMLHEVLEMVPFDSLASSPSLDDWVGNTSVCDVFDRALARNGITATVRQRRQAEEMIFGALTAKLYFDEVRQIPPLHQCPNRIAEMEFLFPFPEEFHPSIAENRPYKLAIEKGFIKGFVDLVVEWNGLVYFADWKSDVLPSYQTGVIANHVELNYETQVKLYSLALVKALGIETESQYERLIGGLFYVFLRAMRPAGDPADGIYFKRLAWSEVLRYEAELKRFDPRAEGGST